MSDSFVNIPNSGSPRWKSPVPTGASLPPIGNTQGDVRVTLDTSSIWEWDGSSWVMVASPSGVSPAFGVIQVPFGTNPVADNSTDTLTLTSNDSSITITGTASTDSVDLALSQSYIHSLNGLTPASQTFATGTTGSDFNISSATSTHTFNLPTASASNRGALSSTDWTTFNNKQAAGNYITALTGDVTASGPGSSAATIANTSVIAASYGSATQVGTFTVNSQGRLTSASNTSISITSSAITDFNESAQDAVGNILTDTASIDFTYNDSGNTITADVLPGGVNHDALLNFVSNKHIDHSTVSINTGTGLSGGGDITISRTLNLANTAVTAGSYGSASQVSTFTVDAQGRLTLASNTSIQITESQVTNLTTDLSNKQSTTLTNTHILVGNASNIATDIAVSGDLTLANTGAFTFNTVNSNVGSFGSSTSIPSFTVNAKGLITAASGNVVIAPAGTLTGTTLASNVVTSSLTSLGVQSQALNLGSHLINFVTDPVSAQDAATKNYVDTGLAALNPATSVYAATTTNISGTYLNGVGGIGATFTTTATGTFTVDGVTPPLNSRVLFKDQTSQFQNGIYNITTLGSIGIPAVFTRAFDYDTPDDVNMAGLIPVINGTVNALTSWQQIAIVTTIGTDSLIFSEFTANPSLYLLKANNLSDVSSASTSFGNISPLTTKGDVLGYSTLNARLPVGTNNQVLTADSTQTLGIKWSTPITNSLTSAHIFVGNGSNIPTDVAVSGDLTLANTGAFTIANLAVTNAKIANATIDLTTKVTGVLPVANGGTSLATLTANNVILGNGTSAPNFVAPGTSGNLLTSNGTTWISSTPATNGTVTSVALTVPSILNISGSPITTSGTLAVTLANESANTVFAGPTTGAATTPTFRALVGADLPNPSSSTLGGIQSYAAVSNQWINSISTSGVPTSTQPVFSNIFGTASLTTQVSGILPIANGGTNSSTANGGFNNLSPMTTLGDIIYENATPVATRLAGNTTATKNFLTQTGNGSISAAPAWGTIAAGDLPTIALTGNVTGSASGGSIATTIATNVVTNSMLAQMPANTIKGNNTGSTANALDLTTTQVKAMVNVRAVLTKTANYTVATTDLGTMFCLDTLTTSAFSLTLPSAATAAAGFWFSMVDSKGNFSTNNLTLVPNGTDKISGLNSNKVLSTNWGGWTIFTDGTSWFMI